MQLIEIKITPAKYEIEIEKAKFEMQQTLPTADVKSAPQKMQFHSKNMAVQIDTREAKASMGIPTLDMNLRKNAQDSKEHINQKTVEYVQIGKTLGNIPDAPNIGQIVRDKMLEQPQLHVTFIPKGGAQISWTPMEIELSFTPGEVNYDWQIQESQFDYAPGSVNIIVVDPGSVDITYTGGTMYVPPSADPSYEE